MREKERGKERDRERERERERGCSELAAMVVGATNGDYGGILNSETRRRRRNGAGTENHGDTAKER